MVSLASAVSACQWLLDFKTDDERERLGDLDADVTPTKDGSVESRDSSAPPADGASLALHCASPRPGAIYCADFEGPSVATYGLPEDAGYSIVPGGLDGVRQLQIDVEPAVSASLVDLSPLNLAGAKVTLSADVTCLAKYAIFVEINDVVTGVVGLVGAPTAPMIACIRPKGIASKMQLRLVLLNGSDIMKAPAIVLVDDVPDSGVQRVEFSVVEHDGTLTASALGDSIEAPGTLGTAKLALRTHAQQAVLAFVDNLSLTVE